MSLAWQESSMNDVVTLRRNENNHLMKINEVRDLSGWKRSKRVWEAWRHLWNSLVKMIVMIESAQN